MSVQETTVCRENEVEFLELLVGYDILAIISNAADGFASCLSTEQLDSIFAPSAAVTDWNQLNTEAATAENPGVFPELPLTVIVPEDTTLTYAVLDVIVSGVGFRSDATSADFDTILETVRSTSGAISAIPLELALANPDILPIAIQFPGSEAGCLPPSVDFVEQGLYPVLTPLLVYVNKAAQETLGDFLTVLGGESSAESIVSAGFSPASVATYETNLAIIAGEQASRTTSTEDATFDIPPVLTGTVTVGGATTGFTLANTAASNLTTDQANLTITRDFSGEALGITAFCNGELDILFVNGDGAFECEEESPDALTISLGYQAVVLLANAADDHTTCLTLDQIQTIWSASSTETVTQWSDVAESMPEQAMTLFGIRESNDILSDIMLTPADGGAAAPIRIDTEINFDPLYRAAAVANVEGALTYMKWSDYERVVQNGQERIQLVLINGDNGCIQPSEETITSGEYPLSLQTSVVINKASLADLSVESYVWTIFADSSLSYLNAAGFVGINANDLLAIRQDLLVEYTAALLAAAEIEAAAAEATEEAPEGDGAEATETAAEPAATEESSE
ncbi:MAG: substrate-binding domain-containing protein [Anaerolineae bacterium]|nr:substrate-binding domain-containing protein [Anaerolineae bacterium]